MEKRVCSIEDIRNGEMKLFSVNDKEVVVANVDGKFYAFQQSCTHKGGSLDEGMLLGKDVMCPLHGAQFDITSGRVTNGPATRDISTYKVQVKGNDVNVDA